MDAPHRLPQVPGVPPRELPAETLQRHLTGCCPDLFEAEVRARGCLISSIHGRFRHLTTPLSW